MAIAKQISLNGTVIDIGGCTEVWNIVESSGTYSITGHSTPYADITSVLNKNGAVILQDSLNRYFYMAGNFGSGSEERYSFTYNEATERRVFNIYSNNTITYTTPTGGAPQYHRSTDTTYGIGSENYYGHNKVINNLTTASYTEGESLSAYQGKVLKDAVDGKQASITGGATTITSSNLTASRALVSTSAGKVGVSAVTSTELGYLDGVTSNVQTQINNLKSSLPNKNAVGVTNMTIASATGSSVTETNVPAGSFTLDAGVWLIVVNVRWSGNSTGYRAAWLSNTEGGSSVSYAAESIVQAATGTATNQQIVYPVILGSGGTYYITIQQNSGASLTVVTRYNTLKISS